MYAGNAISKEIDMRIFDGLNSFRQLMALGFSTIFFVLALSLAGMTADALLQGLLG